MAMLGTKIAKKLKLHGAGQDLLSDAFSGNVKVMGPGVAEMHIEEWQAETVIIFMADKTSAGAWNMPLYKMFADPAFDEARRLENQAADYLRRHGPFEPHRLPLEEMEYTTMPQVMKKLEKRIVNL